MGLLVPAVREICQYGDYYINWTLLHHPSKHMTPPPLLRAEIMAVVA